MIDLTPQLDSSCPEPLYRQLYRYIRNEISFARLLSGTKLPSPRYLSKVLGVSKTTVDAAFEQLAAEGYITSQPRRGYFVARLDFDLIIPSLENPEESPTRIQQVNTYIDFHTARMDLPEGTYKIWRKFSCEAMDALHRQPMTYGDSWGNIGLRRQLAQYLRYSRGVNCTEEQVVICGGTQQAIGLLCQFFSAKYKSVGFEEPGYHDARLTFKNHGYDVIPIHVDSKGLDVQTLTNCNTQMVYVTPGHQYPLGVVMPMSRRLELLKWAKTVNGIVIEDDYDSEFRYTGHPIPCLQGLEDNSPVVYLGTFSKTLMPSIRVSYMVLPQHLLSRFREFYNYDSSVSTIHQETLRLFLEQGEWGRHIRRMRKIYSQKRQTLINSLTENFGDAIKVFGDKTGLHVGLKFSLNCTVDELQVMALKAGAKVYPIQDAWTPPNFNCNKIFLGFGGLETAEIVEGIRRLKQAWSETTP